MPRSKPFTQFPYDEGMSPQTRQALDWMVTQINQLAGQANAPSGQGLQAIAPNSIDPTTQQIISQGVRTGSITTPLGFSTTSTSISLFWDGSNNSLPFQIFRDDGTVTGPVVAGSGLTVSGLSPSTTYFLYGYWDEASQTIHFASVPGVSVGTPPIAFTATNYAAAHQQILRGRIPISASFSSAGITTPASGTTSGNGGSSGGSGSGTYCPLHGAPVSLWGPSHWWSKKVMPCSEFIRITTCTGRVGTFSRDHRMYCGRGLLPLTLWEPTDVALTVFGEEHVQSIENLTIPDGKVDSYDAVHGHIFTAWGFICHNFKGL